MGAPARYFIVEAAAMPEIIRKVAEAKRLLETGEEDTVNGAVRAVGISRPSSSSAEEPPKHAKPIQPKSAKASIMFMAVASPPVQVSGIIRGLSGRA